MYFILLCFADTVICTSWRCMATLHLHYFPKSICSLNVSVSYLLIFKIFQTLLWLYLLWWSVINSLCCYCWNCCYYCSEQLGLCPCETASFIDKCMCSDHSTHQLFPMFFLSSSLPIAWVTIILKLGQWIILQWPLSGPVKRRIAHLLL